MKRVGFYGGSFNPPHVGHQSTILYAMECADIEGLMVAPAYKHPDGKALVNFEDRVNLCWEMVQPFSAMHCPVWVSDVEHGNWNKNGSGLTLNALHMVLDRFKCETVVLILGTDIKDVFGSWEGFDGIMKLVDEKRVEIFWVDRVGGWSSTNVRYLIKNGQSTSRMLPARIRRRIDENGWYK